MYNTMEWCKMLWYEEQCCTKNKAVAWCAMPQNKEQCHSSKSNVTASLRMAKNAMAQCTIQLPKQWHNVPWSCTLWQQEEWQLTQNGNGNVNSNVIAMPTMIPSHCCTVWSPQKSLIKLGYFFQLLQFFPFWKVWDFSGWADATIAHGSWSQLIVL